MAKFAKGDKVESVKTGAKGVVDEVYGDEKYAVLFDGATNPDRVEGYQIKAANGCARNAKFREHDWVEITDGEDKGRKGFITKYWNEAGVDLYEVYFRDNKGGGSTYGIAERALKPTTPNAVSVRSANAVVQNAINARRARNAMDDEQATRIWDEFKRKIVALKREADTLRAKFRSEKKTWHLDQIEYVCKFLQDFVQEYS